MTKIEIPSTTKIDYRIDEAVDYLIVRQVQVNRNRNPQDALGVILRHRFLNDPGVVSTMPRGEGEEVDVHFFKLDLESRGGRISDEELEEKYESHGLVPDPYAQAAVNENDLSFADYNRNGTHWKDGNGRWCSLTFFEFAGERRMRVFHQGDHGLNDHWFGGVPK
ncbi:MAG: hypothetical protein Q7S26_00535 [bacterium]|nr:hypothetical protein [bacterium]